MTGYDDTKIRELCTYNARLTIQEKDQESPIVLESTRSYESDSAWWAMESFDINQELSRLRRVVQMVRKMNPEGLPPHAKWEIDPIVAPASPELLAFIAMAFDNIDQHLIRMGTPPTGWTET